MKIGLTVFLIALLLTNLRVAKDEYDHRRFASACVGAFSAGICTAGFLVCSIELIIGLVVVA